MTGGEGAHAVRDERRAVLAANLAAVGQRVTRACEAAGRDPSGVTVIVVTKFFPASDVRRLASLGVHDMGENRDQEASIKYADVRSDTPGIRLHFIGQLQTNKAPSVASYADIVHTVDRLKLARALDRAATQSGRRLRVLVQLDLDSHPGLGPGNPVGLAGGGPIHPEPGRGGADPMVLPDLVAAIRDSTSLDLGGVMAVAPLGADPDRAFGRLAELAGQVRDMVPEASWVSAGMSGDLEAAIRHGATHLRVGTAILGSRPPLR